MLWCDKCGSSHHKTCVGKTSAMAHYKRMAMEEEGGKEWLCEKCRMEAEESVEPVEMELEEENEEPQECTGKERRMW